MRERLPITHVAIRFEGKIYSLPKPNRHHDVRALIVEQTGAQFVDVGEDDEGFLDSSGQYLRRRPALMNALLHDQVKDASKIRLGMLFSEDIW